ncbi:hypothetical protein ACE1OA_06560 [Streptomyces sp. JL2001]|uniref:hypothetical protein n=1 Tax=Streptomyces sp. JL2001 TaxID=3342488 RepID=UPI003D809561
MKTFWTILTFALTALAVGGLMNAQKAADGPSLVGDVVIAGVLGLGAAASWRKRKALDTSSQRSLTCSLD